MLQTIKDQIITLNVFTFIDFITYTDRNRFQFELYNHIFKNIEINI